MVKLVILIETMDTWQKFDEYWPQFLHYAEQMPGLLREGSSRIDAMLYGDIGYVQMHELYFETQEAAQRAMSSSPGKSAGRILQKMTGGNMALFFADYKEDTIENLRSYSQGGEENAEPEEA